MKPNIARPSAIMRETYTPPPEKAVYGNEAAQLFLASLKKPGRILDIGAGDDGNGFGGMCRGAGHSYEVFDWKNGDDWEHPTTRASLLDAFDGVYMCHSLEHMMDTHAALRKVGRVLKPGGVFAVTVPPLKHKIVGGHVSLWNAGLLLYRLILAGFDCKAAAVKTYGYNISVVVRYRTAHLPDNLKHDSGDIAKLSNFFPNAVCDGFDGQIDELQWKPV